MRLQRLQFENDVEQLPCIFQEKKIRFNVQAEKLYYPLHISYVIYRRIIKNIYSSFNTYLGMLYFAYLTMNKLHLNLLSIVENNLDLFVGLYLREASSSVIIGASSTLYCPLLYQVRRADALEIRFTRGGAIYESPLFESNEFC